MEVARFEKRIFAYIIDLIAPLFLGIGSGIILGIFTKFPWYFSMLVGFMTCYFSYLLINIAFMISTKGLTLGALIFRIHTISNNGETISNKNIVVKELYLGLIPLVIVNGIYMITIHTENTLFDKITNSIVVDSDKADLKQNK